MLKLKVFKNNRPYKELEVNEEDVFTVGREAWNKLVLDSVKISREHCKIFFSEGQWIIEDTKSKNGTILNNKEIKRDPLKNGDKVELFEYRIEVSLPVKEVKETTMHVKPDETVFAGSRIERATGEPVEKTGPEDEDKTSIRMAETLPAIKQSDLVEDEVKGEGNDTITVDLKAEEIEQPECSEDDDKTNIKLPDREENSSEPKEEDYKTTVKAAPAEKDNNTYIKTAPVEEDNDDKTTMKMPADVMGRTGESKKEEDGDKTPIKMAENEKDKMGENEPVDGKTFVFIRPQEEKVTKLPESSVEVLEGGLVGEVQLFDEFILIGRGEKCDLCLNDKAVSREHLSIKRIDKKFEAVNLNKDNMTWVNGKEITKAFLENEDVIKVGETTLRVKIPTGIPASFKHISPPPRKIGMKKALVYAGILIVVAMIGFQLMTGGEKATDVQQAEDAVKTVTKKHVVIGEPAIETTSTIVDLEKELRVSSNLPPEKKMQASVHLNMAKELFANGNYQKALTRFNIVLGMDPENLQVKKYISLSHANIGEANKVIDTLTGFNKRIESKLKEVRRLKKRGEYTKANKLLRLIREIIKSFVAHKSGPEGLMLQNFGSYKSLLNTQDILVKDVSNMQANLNIKIADTIVASKAKARQLARVKKLYKKAEGFLGRGETYLALQEWDNLVSLGIKSKETTKAKKKVKELRTLLISQTAPDYERAGRHIEKQEYLEAFHLLQRVVKIYPEHYEAVAKKESALKALEEKAEKFYQEGLVYEGIGKTNTAIKKWTQAANAIPVQSSELYQKATDKLQKYGRN